MPTPVILLRLLATLFLVASVALPSYWAGARLLGIAAPPLARLLATSIIGLAISTMAFHLAIPVHLFTLPAALAGGAILLAATLAFPANRRLLGAAGRADLRALRRLARAFRDSGHRAWIVVYSVAALPVVVRPLITPPIAWDWIM